MTAWLRPEVLSAYASMWANNAAMRALWRFDTLVSFSIAFAVVYGLFSFCEKLFPPPLGRRPRVWTVPFLFAATALLFPFFIDRFVATVIQTVTSGTVMALMRWFPWFPEDFTQGVVDVAKVAACLWVFGSVVLSCRLIRALAAFAKTAGGLPAVPSDSPIRPLVRKALAAVGVGKTVTVKIAPAGSPVVSYGVARSHIVIPEDFAERYSRDEQYAMLVHECVHVRNHDALKLLLLSFAKSLFWFDPVVLHAIKRMKSEMELLCDWTAVNACGITPPVYAALLVKAVAAGPGYAPGFSDTYRLIASRLSHVLRDADMLPPARVSRRGAFFLTAGLALTIAAAGVLYAGVPPAPAFQPPVQDGGQDGAEAVRHVRRDGVFGQYVFFEIVQNNP